VQPSEELLKAVETLSEKSGFPFQISPEPVPGTSLFVVHTPDHGLSPGIHGHESVLGFRAPFNFPDAAPEDSFLSFPST